jgi:hypothetical protein
MHNELRYQAKTHAISEKLSKEKKKKKTNKQQRHAYGKGNDI